MQLSSEFPSAGEVKTKTLKHLTKNCYGDDRTECHILDELDKN